MEILNLLDKLESLATTSGRIPATKKAIVDLERVLELVDQIRLALPKDVQEAEEILMKRESVVNSALVEARRIRADAESESRNRLEDNTLVKEAHKQAEEVLADAKHRADLLVQDSQRKAHQLSLEAEQFAQSRTSEASHYAQEVLLKLEQQMSALLNSIRRGLDSLENIKEPAASPNRSNGPVSAYNGQRNATAKREAPVS